MLIRPGSLPQVIESQSAMLGLLDDAVESGSTIDISVETGDRVLLYTDGFTESFDSEQQMLGVNRFQRIVGEVSSLPLASMKDEIVNRVNDWRRGPSADDMSLILLEIQ